MTATARRRRLARLADASGTFRVLALDHRDSLRAVLAGTRDAGGGPAVSDGDLVELKTALAGAVGDRVTGAMLDPRIGMQDAVLAALPARAGVIAALEAQGYLADASVTHTTLLEDWGPLAAASRGADAVKLLALWSGRPEPEQLATIEAAVDAAHEAGLPLVLEPLPRGLPPTGEWVLEWVRQHRATGADVLKLPFPGSAAACEEVSGATGVPWTLLSAGAGFETFLDQLRTAMAAGADGYIVGRAVWREAATLDADARARAIDRHVLPRLERLGEVAP